MTLPQQKGGPPAGATTNTGDLAQRLAKLEAIVAKLTAVIKVEGASAAIQVGGELRLTGGKVRIDAPGGVEVQPHLRTTMLQANIIDGAQTITCQKINGVRLTKVPPFIVPF